TKSEPNSTLRVQATTFGRRVARVQPHCIFPNSFPPLPRTRGDPCSALLSPYCDPPHQVCGARLRGISERRWIGSRVCHDTEPFKEMMRKAGFGARHWTHEILTQLSDIDRRRNAAGSRNARELWSNHSKPSRVRHGGAKRPEDGLIVGRRRRIWSLVPGDRA